MIWPDQLGSSDQYVQSSIFEISKKQIFWIIPFPDFENVPRTKNLKSEQTTKSAGRGVRGYDRVFAVDRSPRLSINELFPSQYSRDKTSI